MAGSPTAMRPTLTHFCQVGRQRLQTHADITVEQMHLEPLVGNHSVGAATDGRMLPAASALPPSPCFGAGAPIAAAATLVLPPASRHTLQSQTHPTPAWDTEPQQRAGSRSATIPCHLCQQQHNPGWEPGWPYGRPCGKICWVPDRPWSGAARGGQEAFLRDDVEFKADVRWRGITTI